MATCYSPSSQAQMASTHASAVCDTKKNHYAAPEVSFANSWQNSAEYVAAAHFQSNLEMASKFLIPLPSRVLKEGDVAPNIEGLSTEENNSLYTFSWMDSINRTLGGTLVNMWKNAMCSVVAREKGKELLEQILLTTNYNAITLMGILTTMATSC